MTNRNIEFITDADIRETIARRNAALPAADHILHLFQTDQGIYMVGAGYDGFYCTWAINPADWSSYWGHYRFKTSTDALLDAFERADVPQSSLSQFI